MEACIELVWMCSVCGCGWKVVQLPSMSAVPPYWAIFSTLCGVRVLLPLYFNSYITQRRGYNLLVFAPSLFLVYNITWKKVPETTPAHSAGYWTQVVSEKKSKDAKNKMTMTCPWAITHSTKWEQLSYESSDTRSIVRQQTKLIKNINVPIVTCLDPMNHCHFVHFTQWRFYPGQRWD